MVLSVEFEQFPGTVKRVLACDQAYVSPQGQGTLLTATDHKGLLVLCHVEAPPADVEAQLQEQGMETFPGLWSLDGQMPTESGSSSEAYVAAVAYASEEPKPGIWMDAYGERPTLASVLRSMYDEFRANGEIPEDVSLEEFIRLANPNVVILSPDQIGQYVEAKIDC